MPSTNPKELQLKGNGSESSLVGSFLGLAFFVGVTSKRTVSFLVLPYERNRPVLTKAARLLIFITRIVQM